MIIETILGIKWKAASYVEISIILGIIILVLIFFILLKYYQNLSNKRIHDYQLFLFKLKRLGLSNFQIKILNNMIKMLRLPNPTELLQKPAFFETDAGKFISFLRRRNESKDSLELICKDISIIYDRLYYPEQIKKPLEKISDIDENHIIYFTIEKREIFLGKVISRDSEKMVVSVFGPPRDTQNIGEKGVVSVYIWRVGDAEYKFETSFIKNENRALIFKIPEKFTRDKEFRHPYIDVILPATIIKAHPRVTEEPEPINATIYKLNDYEAVIRLAEKIDYNTEYYFEFFAMDFKFKILARPLSAKTIEESNSVYYTLKFDELSEGAAHVLKQYIYEHL